MITVNLIEPDGTERVFKWRDDVADISSAMAIYHTLGYSIEILSYDPQEK